MDQYNKNDLNNISDNSNNKVKFNEEHESMLLYHSDTPKIIQWVIKYSGGLIKNEKQANYILIGFIIIAIIVSLLIFFNNREVTKIHSITTPNVLPR